MQLEETLTKKILASIYIQSLKSDQFSEISDRITSRDRAKPEYMPAPVFGEYLAELERHGLVCYEENSLQLTLEGRKKILVVMIGGSFDIIHPGHIDTLRQAKTLGDVLVVSVARDSTYKRNKGKEPIHNENLRQELVSCVKFVDAAVLGSEDDIFETVRFLKPDIIALGYDQLHSESAIKEGAKKVGIEPKVVRLKSQVPDIKTSSIFSTSNKRGELLTGT
jgi:cytidyltransferase-like protein